MPSIIACKVHCFVPAHDRRWHPGRAWSGLALRLPSSLRWPCLPSAGPPPRPVGPSINESPLHASSRVTSDSPTVCGDSTLVQPYFKCKINVLPHSSKLPCIRKGMLTGGRGGIRTHERLAPLPVFKTGAFNRSATLPYVSAGPCDFNARRPAGCISLSRGTACTCICSSTHHFSRPWRRDNRRKPG